MSGRFWVVLAAVLWSLSGLFTPLFKHPTGLGLNEPALSSLQIAFWRNLFAGLALLPLLRPSHIRVRPAMGLMVLCFASMSMLYVTAQTIGQAAVAGLLQYTAPFWMVIGSVWLLREPIDQRSVPALAVGCLGVAVILAGSANELRLGVSLLALGSGLAFASVMLCLRYLREESSVWLTVLNLLGSTAVIWPFVWSMPLPTLPQLGTLAIFGTIQMAAPYLAMTRGMRTVSPQEAGILTLLEPILIAAWATLVSPEQEMPSVYTMVGGAIVLGSLLWRYLPSQRTPS